jgi:hypothetical protein
MIFVNSMSDLFHEDIPADYIEQIFEVMGKAHWHTFQAGCWRARRMTRCRRARAAADMVAGAIGSLSPAGMVNSSAVADLVSTAMTKSRQLDRGNANPGSLGADFKSFDLDIWDAAKQLHVRTGSRLRRLEQLNVWRDPVRFERPVEWLLPAPA